MLVANDFLRGRAVCRQPIPQPAQCGCDFRILIAEAADELHCERLREWSAFDRLHHGRDRFRRAVRRPQQAVGDKIGGLTKRAAADDAVGAAAQIFDQHDLQQCRQRPELADRERLHTLVRCHEPTEHEAVEAAVGVRDERPGESEYSWKARQRADGEFWQLPVVTRRQVVVNLANLALDDVVVVVEPVRCRRRRPPFGGSRGDPLVIAQQRPTVLAHPPRDRATAGGAAADRVGASQGVGETLEPLDAQQLLADRRRFVPR